MATADTKRLQRGLNFFVAKYLAGHTPLMVDGAMGRSTRARVRRVKFYLGYAGAINPKVDETFLARLWHPKSVRYSSPVRLRRAARRRIKQRRDWKRNHRAAIHRTGIGTFDGIPVRAVLIPILLWCRAHGWRGVLVSGYRTPAYSRSLCINRCGQPRCPGRCAGEASNHVRIAVDVSDYENFGRIVVHCPLEPKIHNSLPQTDPVHFSPSGN